VRILLAVDGSPRADVARELVAAIDWPQGSTIRLLSVISSVSTLFATPWAPSVGETDALDSELAAHAGELLEQAARQLAASGCAIEREIVRGRPASAILEQSAAWPPDIVVLGSRGHGRIASMLLGSVAAEVVDHAEQSVLVARVPSLTRVVLAHDGSAYARGAEELLSRWPIFGRAAIEVVSVAPAPFAGHTTLAAAMAAELEDHARAAEAGLDEHRAIANDAAGRLRADGLRASAVVAQGNPAEGVIGVANGSQADLIVIGTHGRTGLTRVLLGSVARNVMLHAACSVLVARQPAVSIDT